MAKIYSDAVDKNVERIILYISEDVETKTVFEMSATYAFKDAECTQPVFNDELKDYFLKGMAVSYNNGNSEPTIEVVCMASVCTIIDGDKCFVQATTATEPVVLIGVVGKDFYDRIGEAT